MAEELDTSGEGPVSDAEVEAASREIFNILRIFESPKDAASALLHAQYEFFKAIFPPGYKKEAFAAIDAGQDLLKKLLSEGWQ